MPLQATSCTNAERQKNIEKLMHEYKTSGMIGDTKPRDSTHAQEIASAICYDLQRKCREKRRK